MLRHNRIDFRATKYAYREIDELCFDIGCSIDGLSSDKADDMRERFGVNEFNTEKASSLFKRIRRAFINPFNIILFILGIIAVITDVISEPDVTKNPSTAIIIFAMIIISGIVRLMQELKAKNAAEQLDKMIRDEVTVKRDGEWTSLPASEIVVGDLISFSAGDKIPADVRITRVNDLFTSQAALTGESTIIENTASSLRHTDYDKISSCKNLAFMATTVISGKGEGIVLSVGTDTVYGSFINKEPSKEDSFRKGANSIAWVMLKFMVVLIPIIFVLLGITGGKWFESLTFALSVAVGLVPEMLPMVITACLAKGSLAMSKKQTIVKNINAMQTFGSMDILCMDKTGTLTNESILLEYYMDVLGNESTDVLDAAYINSLYHSGICNPIDNAIIACNTMPNKEAHFISLSEKYKKLDEIPFDHSRKMVSILVSDESNSGKMLIKGDIENVISRCSKIRYRGETISVTDEWASSVYAVVDEMLQDGMKVIAVAEKSLDDKSLITLTDEKDMTLIGYLAFFNAPKASAKQSVEQLKELKVRPKIITGDVVPTTKSVCRRVGIAYDSIITGDMLNDMSDAELSALAEDTDVFAELTPVQKVRVVSLLRENGHTVGFLGDGINDIPVLNEADVGISVDTAVDAAKDGADVVLLHKDLTVLTQGILEGRRIFTNMMKYMKITASSNFGNIFSIVCASAFLPFLPMASIQILLLNLLYDILCIVLPWDNVDKEDTLSPKVWSGKSLPKFMLSFGPISSLFDIVTFLFLYFVLCPRLCGGALFSAISDSAMQLKYIALFQTGWFLESLWSQVLILHFLRTPKIPFRQSKPSLPVILITLTGIIVFTCITFTSAGAVFGLTKMPVWYFVFLCIILITYMLLASLMKRLYLKRYNELL